MKLKKDVVVISAFLVTLIINFQCCNAIPPAVMAVGAVISTVASILKGTWQFLDEKQLVGNYSMDDKHKEVVRRIAEVSNTINMVELKLQNSAAITVNQLQTFIHLNGKFERNLEVLSDVMSRISKQMNNMNEYSKNLSRIENYTLHDFATSMVAHNPNSILGLLDRMYTITLGNPDLETLGTRGLFFDCLDYLEISKSSLCNFKTSAQQIILNLYNAVAINGLKGYSLLQFSWMLLKTYGKGNFTVEAETAKMNFNENINNIHDILNKFILNKAERTVFRCDPAKEHIEGETYEQLTRLLQGFIENEVNMNDAETCTDSCENYRRLDQGCFRDCNSRYKCKGKIHNCWSIDTRTEICNSPANSTRRYEYIQYESGKVLGQKRNCPGGVGDVDSWSYWLFWRCTYCFCLCEEEGIKSDRYFSLRESVSNTAYNRIVTGVKFVKMNRIIHLQIQEGQLQPEGTVDRSTVQWVPTQEFNIIGKNVKIGRDIHILSMAKRSIDFDTLDANDTHIVTGVKLRLVDSHLSLQIRVTEFDFSTGRLLNPESSSYWMGNDNKAKNNEERRTKLEIHQPDIPVRSVSPPSNIDATDNTYMDFTHSSIDSDAAQSTIPFIDIQEVTSDPPVPLAGIGLYHKGRKLSGGFVAPQIITYNYANMLRPQFVD